MPMPKCDFNKVQEINLDEIKSIGTRWIACMQIVMTKEHLTMQNTWLGLDLNIFQKKLKKLKRNKNITTNPFRIQAYDSIIYGYFCIGFIDLTWKGKSLLDYTNLFSFNGYAKNDKIILKYFQ